MGKVAVDQVGEIEAVLFRTCGNEILMVETAMLAVNCTVYNNVLVSLLLQINYKPSQVKNE